MLGTIWGLALVGGGNQVFLDERPSLAVQPAFSWSWSRLVVVAVYPLGPYPSDTPEPNLYWAVGGLFTTPLVR